MNPPPTLAPYIFLLSDTSTRQLACDVAFELATQVPGVFVDDFLSPIQEAFSAMFELDMKRDLASPKDNGRLMLDFNDGEETEGDAIMSLERWFCDHFGEKKLGKMALERAQIARNDFDYSFIYRDAQVSYLGPFLDALPWSKLLLVDLRDKTIGEVVPRNWPAARCISNVDANVDQIVEAIVRFDNV